MAEAKYKHLVFGTVITSEEEPPGPWEPHTDAKPAPAKTRAKKTAAAKKDSEEE
jgi:hypothetical protein|nr:MAG TPA: hypothetical protein [Caudoviricetes sp.]